MKHAALPLTVNEGSPPTCLKACRMDDVFAGTPSYMLACQLTKGFNSGTMKHSMVRSEVHELMFKLPSMVIRGQVCR